MGTATIINALNMELTHSARGTATNTINEKNMLILKLTKVLEAHAAAEDTILSNESLSPEGKAQALKKFGTEQTGPALQWLRRVVEDHQQTDEGYRTRFFAITSGITDAAERLPIFVYLWNKLDTLDPNQLNIRFLQAAEQDQVVVLSAMLENPMGAMVTEDVKEKALMERAQRLTPQQVEAFEQNQILLEFLAMFRDWVGRWLALEVRVELPIIRTSLGDDIADALTTQVVTGIPRMDAPLVGAST